MHGIYVPPDCNPRPRKDNAHHRQIDMRTARRWRLPDDGDGGRQNENEQVRLTTKENKHRAAAPLF